MKRIPLTILSVALISGSSAIANACFAAAVGSTGSFTPVEKPTSGKVKIVKDGNKTFVELSGDFQTSKDGPDLHVTLHKEDKLTLHLKDQKFTNLGALKSYSGVQRYEIPASVNLKEVKSVGIWCKKFDATFGYAPLK